MRGEIQQTNKQTFLDSSSWSSHQRPECQWIVPVIVAVCPLNVFLVYQRSILCRYCSYSGAHDSVVFSSLLSPLLVMATVTWTLGKSGLELNTANSCSQYVGQYLGYYYCYCFIVHNWPLSTIHGYQSLSGIATDLPQRLWRKEG